jgi:hypothetical protein
MGSNYKRYSRCILAATTRQLKYNGVVEDPIFKAAFSNFFSKTDGPTIVQRHLTRHETVLRDLFYGFIEILRCIERLTQIETYIRKMPGFKEYKRKNITDTAYMKYHIEKYFEEMYILKERLIRYLRKIKKYYKRDVNIQTELAKMEDLLNKSLDGIISTRGRHIHESRFTDEDINRLELYDLLLSTGMPRRAESLFRAESRRVRRNWLARIKGNNRDLMKVMDFLFEYLHVLVFDDKRNVRIK